jgi:hypothetical protein
VLVQANNEDVVHLERLAAELGRRGLNTQLVAGGRRPFLKVTNPDIPELTERVLCGRAEDGTWCYFWPWRQPIGPADDLETVAGRIAAVLRSVEGHR